MGEVLISGGSRGLGAGLIKLFRAEKLDRENINEFKTKTYFLCFLFCVTRGGGRGGGPFFFFLLKEE